MAFRATNVVPQRAYQQVKGAAAQLKINAAAFIAAMAANGATYSYLRDVYMTLYNANAQFTSLASTPGLAAYAAAQEDDESYDVAAEFATMQAAIVAVGNWMQANVPTNVTAVAPASWPGTQSMIATTFTAAQTQPLRTLLQALVDTIE